MKHPCIDTVFMRTKVLHHSLGGASSLNSSSMDDWLNVLNKATLELVPIPRFSNVSRMLRIGHLSTQG